VKRLLVLFGLVMMLGLVVAMPAAAFVNIPTLNPKATLSASGTSAVVSGTITCTAGDEVGIDIIIQQASGQVNAAGQGQATITCNGQVQNWSATVDVLIGSSFKKGPAVVLFSASDNTDGNDTPALTQGIKLG
jgi:hypothetical protein